MGLTQIRNDPWHDGAGCGRIARKATCWQGIRDDLKIAGAGYSDKEVVIDGNLITSRCPQDLPAFSQAFREALRG
ncbi:MAG: DJ-1/PfpI family protein [Planctomycetota bacterium]